MKDGDLTGDLVVAEVLARWPEVIQVFLSYRLGCVGCLMAPFDTLAEVARVYNLNLDDFLGRLRERITHRRKRDEDHRRIPG